MKDTTMNFHQSLFSLLRWPTLLLLGAILTGCQGGTTIRYDYTVTNADGSTTENKFDCTTGYDNDGSVSHDVPPIDYCQTSACKDVGSTAAACRFLQSGDVLAQLSPGSTLNVNGAVTNTSGTDAFLAKVGVDVCVAQMCEQAKLGSDCVSKKTAPASYFDTCKSLTSDRSYSVTCPSSCPTGQVPQLMGPNTTYGSANDGKMSCACGTPASSSSSCADIGTTQASAQTTLDCSTTIMTGYDPLLRDLMGTKNGASCTWQWKYLGPPTHNTIWTCL